jgi:methanethiol S-methyltransferase
VISFILIVPLINYTAQLDNNIIISYGLPLTVLRHMLTYGSLLLFFWAFFINYDSLSFFGIRQILAFNKEKKSDGQVELKKNGLLGIIRHPMYLALIIYLWCHTFRLSDIIVNIILTIYVLIGTWLEERKLILEFGDAYIKYQKEVPMIFPFTKIKTG